MMTIDEVCVGLDIAVKWKNKQMLKERKSIRRVEKISKQDLLRIRSAHNG